WRRCRGPQARSVAAGLRIAASRFQAQGEITLTEKSEHRRGTMAENKTKQTTVSASQYIAEIGDEAKRADAKSLAKLVQEVTGEKPAMWGPSIVGFGSYHYKYDSGREGDMPLIGFSPRKPATVLYGATGFTGADALLAKLGKHS